MTLWEALEDRRIELSMQRDRAKTGGWDIIDTQCPECGGAGVLGWERPCWSCGGSGLSWEQVEPAGEDE